MPSGTPRPMPILAEELRPDDFCAGVGGGDDVGVGDKVVDGIIEAEVAEDELPAMLFCAVGPSVPVILSAPCRIFGGKVPVMPLKEKRSEKFMTVPPGVEEFICKKLRADPLVPGC